MGLLRDIIIGRIWTKRFLTTFYAEIALSVAFVWAVATKQSDIAMRALEVFLAVMLSYHGWQSHTDKHEAVAKPPAS